MKLRNGLKIGVLLSVSLLGASINSAWAEIPLYNEDGLFNPLKQQSKPAQVVRQNPMGAAADKPYLNPTTTMKPWEYWGLSEAEWNTYQELLKRSTWSIWEHHATPLTILAMTASPSERRRYARIEAEMDNWRFQKTMDYQVVYNEERLAIAKAFQNRAAFVKNLTRHDRVLFFTRTGDCEPRCRSLLNPLLESGAHVDIYVLGTQDENDVFAWATKAGIAPERVAKKEITLNFETGILTNLTQMPDALADVPVAYWHRAGRYEKVLY